MSFPQKKKRRGKKGREIKQRKREKKEKEFVVAKGASTMLSTRKRYWSPASCGEGERRGKGLRRRKRGVKPTTRGRTNIIRDTHAIQGCEGKKEKKTYGKSLSPLSFMHRIIRRKGKKESGRDALVECNASSFLKSEKKKNLKKRGERGEKNASRRARYTLLEDPRIKERKKKELRREKKKWGETRAGFVLANHGISKGEEREKGKLQKKKKKRSLTTCPIRLTLYIGLSQPVQGKRRKEKRKKKEGRGKYVAFLILSIALARFL